MLLPDTVHAPDALLQLHRIPGQVVVEDHMAELEVEALSACIRRDQYPCLLSERLLHITSFIQVE